VPSQERLDGGTPFEHGEAERSGAAEGPVYRRHRGEVRVGAALIPDPGALDGNAKLLIAAMVTSVVMAFVARPTMA
jgi:hypothetical protein